MPAPKRTRRRYGLEDRERGLAALVLAAGSAENAAKALKNAGCEIPRSTLETWKREDAARYEELRVELSGSVVQRIASEAEALAVQYAEKEAAILASIDETQIAQLSPKERADTLRSLATSKALQIDKVASPLRGRPSVITERRDPDEILRQIERLVGTTDSTADDITADIALPAGSDA